MNPGGRMRKLYSYFLRLFLKMPFPCLWTIGNSQNLCNQPSQQGPTRASRMSHSLFWGRLGHRHAVRPGLVSTHPREFGCILKKDSLIFIVGAFLKVVVTNASCILPSMPTNLFSLLLFHVVKW